MRKKKSLVFQGMIILFIFIITYLSAALNAYALRKSTVEAEAENTAAVLATLMERCEYALKYGRDLENYYGIDAVLEEIADYCGTDQIFIVDDEGNPLYGMEPPEETGEHIAELKASGEEALLYETGFDQNILQAIAGREQTEGYVGISYPQARMTGVSAPYVRSILFRALIASLAGSLLFEGLFHFVRHGYDRKKLRRMILFTVFVLSIGTLISTYRILQNGYRSLAEEVSGNLLEQNSTNIERLIDQGVEYSDIRDADAYFAEIAENSSQVEALRLSREAPSEEAQYRMLPEDDAGEQYYLTVLISGDYIRGKVNAAILNVIVTMVTAFMLSGEVLGFLIDVISGSSRRRRGRIDNGEHKTIETLGVVKGISFFFAGFRFMAVAFMSIVLNEIYQPVVLFGWTIPKELLMSIPLSAQVFISMITSYLSGLFIKKQGWKPAAAGGMAVMIAGTFASAFADAPIPFILAQMLMGVGLGFAKMGIDIYAVAVASEADMADYTAGSNAAIIIGYSCAASIGALIASIVGYSGAYLVMGIIGIAVLLILLYFGMDVKPRVEAEEEGAEAVSAWNRKGPDLRFLAYILCVIIPYYFIMMFVDYFFPVYANSVGITTDVIGLVMMFYGVASAYIGTAVCPVLAKKFSAAGLMAVILLLLSAVMIAFAAKNAVLPAVLLVLLIGIADGIMPSIQFEYVYMLPFAKKAGFSYALGIEGFFSSLIGAAAPVIFGVVMLYGSRGLMLVGGIAVVLAVVFLLYHFAAGQRREEEIQNEKI